jgi:hypothetical protein
MNLSDKAIVNLYVISEQFEKYRLLEDLDERKALGEEIFNKYLRPGENSKLSPILSYLSKSEESALKDILDGIEKYEMKALWVHFLKEELKRPELCMITKIYLLQVTIKFFKKKLFYV